MTYLDTLTENQWLQSIHKRIEELSSKLNQNDAILEALMLLNGAIEGLSQRVQAPPRVIQPELPDFTELARQMANYFPSAQDMAEALKQLVPQENTNSAEILKTLEQLSVAMRNMPGRAWSVGGGNVTLAAGQVMNTRVLNQLIPTEYDEIVLSYTGDNVTTVVYKLATATVATLTLTYSGSNITRVVRT